jgi:hypothetical protein
MELTRLLIEYGADVRIQDKAGLTPLHWAARLGRNRCRPLSSSTMAWVRQSRARTDRRVSWHSGGILLLQRNRILGLVVGRPLTVNPLFDQLKCSPKVSTRCSRRTGRCSNMAPPKEVIAKTDMALHSGMPHTATSASTSGSFALQTLSDSCRSSRARCTFLKKGGAR